MIKPSFDEVMKIKDEYDVIPVYKEVYADSVTPITLLRKILQKSDKCFLLESIEAGVKWGRYSFIGCNPKARLVYKNGVLTITGEGEATIKTAKPYEEIRKYMKNYKNPRFEDLPPFTGGLVGYYGYAMIAVSEPILKLQESETNDFDLMLFDKIIAYDHLREKMTVIVNMKTYDPKRQYDQAVNDINEIISTITDPAPLVKLESDKNVEFTSTYTKEEFCDMVNKTKEYIYDGDIFQCVVSRRFETEYKGSLLNAYRVLRITNPSPYMVYMNIEGDEIISTSPETLVKLQNGVLNTFPIAGSRPRGTDKQEDDALADELIKDEKELAEHNMLVDLGRNDIGKISELGTVKVEKYLTVERYSCVMHLGSTVTGTIKKGKDAIDAVDAILPAGTLSGAPKFRACQIIQELEQSKRGIYGGAIGYVDFTGNLDVCIAIRLVYKKKDEICIRSGAGIVADSVPEKEFEECQNKARAVVRAISQAEEGLE